MFKIPLAIAALLLMILSGEACANFIGSSSGIFSNPDPSCTNPGTTCSVAGNNLTWGSPDQGSQANQVSFLGESSINVPINTSTRWGILNYTNGATIGGTEINSFTLTINFNPDTSSSVQSAPAVNFNFAINSTLNQTCLPSDTTCLENNADWLIWNTVTWMNQGVLQTLVASDYLLSCKSQGCKQDTVFKVLEGASTGVEIIGKFGSAIPLGFGNVLNPEVGFLAAIPEPNTPHLLLVGVVGLFYFLRRVPQRHLIEHHS